MTGSLLEKFHLLFAFGTAMQSLIRELQLIQLYMYNCTIVHLS